MPALAEAVGAISPLPLPRGLRNIWTMKPFDPRQTECLIFAVKTGTIRAAAAHLGLEPSTVSRNIAALERLTATTLLERTKTGVRPTEAGALLWP
jgi:DNA-binding transcriptional LysR family regulator